MKRRDLFQKYGKTFLAGVLICLIAVWARGLFNNTDVNNAYWILSDGTFVAGILLIGGGAYSAVNTAGFFDVITYGVKGILPFLSAGDKKGTPRAKTLYDYTQSKKGTRKTHWHLLIVGAVFLGIAFLFQCLYVPVPILVP